MPEIITQDKYVSQVPRFTLPAELTNPDPSKPAVAPEKVQETPTPEATPKPEATKAVATPPEPEKEPEKETTEKVPAQPDLTRVAKKRIDLLTKRVSDAMARAEASERRLQELETKSQAKPSTTAPRMEDYTDVQEYAKAFASFEKEEALKQYKESQAKAYQEAQVKQLASGWETQVSKAQSKYEDWDEVVGDLKPTAPWSTALMRSENGTEIAYYLGSHEGEAKKIMALDPYSQILEIGRLSHKLSLPVEKPKAPSAAPKPIVPVQTETVAPSTEIRPNQPYEEYRKIGDKRFGRGRR